MFDDLFLQAASNLAKILSQARQVLRAEDKSSDGSNHLYARRKKSKVTLNITRDDDFRSFTPKATGRT